MEGQLCLFSSNRRSDRSNWPPVSPDHARPAGRAGRAGTPRPKIMAETWDDGFYSMAIRRNSVCPHALGLITTQAGPHLYHNVGHWRSLNRLLSLSHLLFSSPDVQSFFLSAVLSVSLWYFQLDFHRYDLKSKRWKLQHHEIDQIDTHHGKMEFTGNECQEQKCTATTNTAGNTPEV